VIEQVDGQVGLFDLDTWSGKTYPEHSAVTEAKTFKPSLKKSSKSQNRNAPICLMLSRGGGGQNRDVCTPTWGHGALLGEYTTRSFGESPSEENVSRLSQILEDCPLPKYSLSAKACQGILNRAERRGKELPPELKAALIAQANLSETDGLNKKEPTTIPDSEMTIPSVCKETESTEPTQPDATVADGVGGELHP